MIDHPKKMSKIVPSPQSNASYRTSLLGVADRLLGYAINTISSLSYGPITAACRMAVLEMLSRTITHGRLRLITSDSIHVFPPVSEGIGNQEAVPEIRVIRDTFWIRLVLLGDMGFAEAYMAGDCDVSDLVQVFKVSPYTFHYPLSVHSLTHIRYSSDPNQPMVFQIYPPSLPVFYP